MEPREVFISGVAEVAALVHTPALAPTYFASVAVAVADMRVCMVIALVGQPLVMGLVVPSCHQAGGVFLPMKMVLAVVARYTILIGR